MLPQNNNLPGKIYVNPNFKGQFNQTGPTNGLERLAAPTPPIPVTAHINPLFLEKQKMTTRPKIHMNPMFLLKLQQRQQQTNIPKIGTINAIPTTSCYYAAISNPRSAEANMPATVGSTSETISTPKHPQQERKIICKSKNRLIREPAQPLLLPKTTTSKVSTLQSQRLVVVSKRKLVRKPVVCIQNDPKITLTKPHTALALKKLEKTKYKIDNRIIRKKEFPSFAIKLKRKSFVGQYALRRTSSSSVTKASNSQSVHKKLQLLNINGLLYKSTKNKLQLKDTIKKAENYVTKSAKHATTSMAKAPQGLTIFVRGTKYVMDPQKFKLTRVSNSEKEKSSTGVIQSPTRSRIDIGGYTYVSAPYAKNVLIRTKNHLARAYVHSAKQKSVHLLTKHLTKSNVPCPIYQRLGKCAAYVRGKCSNVHNKQQVAICGKFLRGECLNSKCLLSHDISLSKMPVCKFFLQGVCVRNDCPYLHKKLSNNAEVCIDFLRGFCKLADKCNKRHEFVCPELERNGSCSNKTCVYCKTRLKKEFTLNTQQSKRSIQKPTPIKDDTTTKALPAQEASTEKTAGKRYFCEAPQEESSSNCTVIENAMEEDITDSKKNELPPAQGVSTTQRPRLGVLPAFIPLS